MALPLATAPKGSSRTELSTASSSFESKAGSSVSDVLSADEISYLLTHFAESSKSLTFEEFYAIISEHLGHHRWKRSLLARIFYKMNTCVGLTVSWDTIFSHISADIFERLSRDCPILVYDNTRVLYSGRRESVLKIEYIPRATGSDTRPSGDDSSGDDHFAGRVCTLSNDGLLEVWKTSMDGHTSAPLAGISRSVRATDFVVMGGLNRVAVALTNRSLRFYDIAALTSGISSTAKFVYEIIELEDNIVTVAFHGTPDAARCALIVGDSCGAVSTFVFHSAKTNLFPKIAGKENTAFTFKELCNPGVAHIIHAARHAVHDEWVCRVAPHLALGSFISCSADPRRSLAIHNGRRITASVAVPGGISCLAVCRRLAVVVTGGRDGLLRVWNTHSTARCIARLEGHSTSIVHLTLADMLASASGGSGGPTGTTAAAAVSSAFAWGSMGETTTQCVGGGPGVLIASTSEDRIIKLWALHDQQCLQTLASHRFHLGHSRISSILFRPELSLLMVGGPELLVFEAAKGAAPPPPPPLSTGPAAFALYSSVFDELILISKDGRVCVWDGTSGKILLSFTVPRPLHATLDHSGRLLLVLCAKSDSGDGDGDGGGDCGGAAADGGCTPGASGADRGRGAGDEASAAPGGHSPTFTAHSPLGKHVGTGSKTECVSPQGEPAAAGACGGVAVLIGLWNFQTGKLVESYPAHPDARLLAGPPAGTLLIVAGNHFHTLRSREEIGRTAAADYLSAPSPAKQAVARSLFRRQPASLSSGHHAAITALALQAPDTMATADASGRVILWSLESGGGKDMAVWDPPQDDQHAITTLVFLQLRGVHGAGVLLGGTAGGSVLCWSRKLQLCGRFAACAGRITALAADPRDTIVCVGDERGTISVWDICDFAVGAIPHPIIPAILQPRLAQAQATPQVSLSRPTPPLVSRWQAHPSTIVGICLYDESDCRAAQHALSSVALLADGQAIQHQDNAEACEKGFADDVGSVVKEENCDVPCPTKPVLSGLAVSCARREPGTRIATAGLDGSLRLWQADASLLAELAPPSGGAATAPPTAGTGAAPASVAPNAAQKSLPQERTSPPGRRTSRPLASRANDLTGARRHAHGKWMAHSSDRLSSSSSTSTSSQGNASERESPSDLVDEMSAVSTHLLSTFCTIGSPQPSRRSPDARPSSVRRHDYFRALSLERHRSRLTLQTADPRLGLGFHSLPYAPLAPLTTRHPPTSYRATRPLLL